MIQVPSKPETCLENNTANEHSLSYSTPVLPRKLKAVYHSNVYKIINPDDIYYAEAASSSVIIHFQNSKMILSNTLKAAEAFFGLHRVHKSFAINISKITAINLEDEEIILQDNKSVFYSRRFPIREIFESMS